MQAPEARKLEIAGPAGRLQASLTSPAQPHLQAVVAHPHPLYGGTMDNLVVLQTALAFSKRGAETLRFNFRGVGHSDGRHSEGRGEVDDLQATLQGLPKQTPDLPIVLAGYSFGGAMALALMTRSEDPPARQPNGLLLLAPPMTHYDFATLESCTLPVAVIYGENDDLTPLHLVRSSLGSRDPEHTLATGISGVGHDLGTSVSGDGLSEALDRSLDWLLEKIRP